MMPSMMRSQRGFTLMEILIVLLMTAVALMALGTFSIAMMDTGTQSRERLMAVHLAEQVVEQWQVDKVNDYPPIVRNNTGTGVCEVVTGTSMPAFPYTRTCKSSAQTQYTVTMRRTQARAPLPAKPNNVDYFYTATKAAHCQNGGSFPDMCDMAGTPTPYVKVVEVSWTHKGRSHMIYLTHLTRP